MGNSIKATVISAALAIFAGCAGHTPLIKGADGKPLPKSIATMEKIGINGIDQTVIIRGVCDTNPLLLFIHGGPGMPEGGMLRKYAPGLENMFIVVDWEQRGAGLTGAQKTPKESMTIEQMCADAVELTRYLLKRFGREKLYLFCHSFGTTSGILAVRNHPELYTAYIGAGQIVDQKRAEQMGYRFCLETAEKQNNPKAIKQLKALSFPRDGSYNSRKYPTTFQSISIERRWLGTFGGVAKCPDSLMPMMMSCVFTKEHTFFQALGFMGRFKRGMNIVWPQVMKYDFLQQASEIKVPVYLIGGKYDMDTPNSLAEEYFNRLSAPRKEFVVFENSGHLAPFEEPERFYSIMRGKVLSRAD